MGLRIIRGAVGAAALLWLGAAQSAAAHGGIQVDTDFLKSFSTCDLGSVCTPADLGFTITRPDGTTFSQIYIYNQGVIGLGAPILGDKATLLAGGLGALGDSFIAPGFSSFSGLTVTTLAVQMGGSVSGFPPDGVRAFLVNWYVDGFPISGEDPDDPDPGHSGRGVFQADFEPQHWTSDGFNFVLNDDISTQISFRYTGLVQADDPTEDKFYDLTGLTPDSQVGWRIGTYAGARPLAVPEVTLTLPGVPEPAAWAMMIVGFSAVGGMLRRGRRRTAAIV